MKKKPSCLYGLFGLAYLLIGIFPYSVHAQTIGPNRVLIRNVILIDPSGVVDGNVVNMLIRDNKLDIVTEDKLSRDDADMVVNARKGVLLGKLTLGQKPSFIIFEEDPRENFDVLLDTPSYSVFAVKDGVVVKNLLMGSVSDEPDEEPVKASWLAYTPPPFMVPLSAQDTTKWNRFQTKYINGIFVAGIILDRMNWLSQDAGSEQAWGDLNFYDGGEIRGFRLGFVGTLNFKKPWVYTIFAASHAFDKGFEIEDQDSLSFIDWRLDIPFFNRSVMSIGKQKETISQDRQANGAFLPAQERAAVSDALLRGRNIGVAWSGSSPEKYTSWAFGVYNDWLEGENSFSENDNQYTGRLSWAPLRSKDESNLLHIDVGYRYSDAKDGFRFLSKPEVGKAPEFVDTGLNSADKTETYNIGWSWRRGPTTLASEYTRTNVSSPQLGNPSFDGYYVTAAWILSGEMRGYDKKSGTFTGIPIAKTVYQNGKGAWELYTRYSHLDLEDKEVHGGEMQIATLGLNWWLTPFFAMSAGYKYIWNEKDGVKGESSGLMTRIILVLE